MKTFKLTLSLLLLATYGYSQQKRELNRGEKIIVESKLFPKQNLNFMAFIMKHKNTSLLAWKSTKSDVKLATLVVKYGKPNISFPAKYLFKNKRVYAEKGHRGENPQTPVKKVYTAHSFDSIIFITEKDDKDNKIKFVVYQAFKFENVKGHEKGLSFKFIPGTGLRAFYENGELFGMDHLNGSSFESVTGKIKDGEYKSYKKDKVEFIYTLKGTSGKFIKYFPNGNKSREVSFVDMTFEGTESTYFPNGKIYRTRELKNGINDGLAKTYYDSGEIMQENPFTKGKLNGVAKEFYKSGKVKKEVTFKEGRPVTALVGYSEDGKVLYKKDVHKPKKK